MEDFPVHRLCLFCFDFINLNLFQLAQALAAGVHPTNDFEGNKLPCLHAALAGKPIAGLGGEKSNCHHLLYFLRSVLKLLPHLFSPAASPCPASMHDICIPQVVSHTAWSTVVIGNGKGNALG